MPAFVVHVNGTKVCSVELTTENSRGIQLSWIGSTKQREKHLLFFHIGGMDEIEHVDWTTPQLKLGDEVTIRIADDSPTDPPSSRKSVEEMDRLARDFGQAPTGERTAASEK
jgi:hypothetical protein